MPSPSFFYYLLNLPFTLRNIFTMKTLSFLSFYFLIASTTFAQNLNWVNAISKDDYLVPNGLTTDLQKNVIMVGEFQGTTDFDPGPNVFSLSSQNSNTRNSFIHKVDSNGNFVWAKSLRSVQGNALLDVAADKKGNIYVVGSYQYKFDIDLGPGTSLFPSTYYPGRGAMVMKLDSTGTVLWVKAMQGTTGNSRINAFSIILNDSNQIFVSGFFNGTLELNPDGMVSNIVTTQNSSDHIFCAKLDSVGDLVWFRSIIQSPSNSRSYDMTIDSEGNPYLVSIHSLSIIITKLNNNGVFQWDKWISTIAGRCRSQSISSDGKGHMYIAGHFTGTLGPGPGQIAPTVIYETPFVYKLDTAGNLVWHWAPVRLQPFGGGYYPKLCLDTTGEVFVTGEYSGTLDFDPGLDTFTLKSKASSDFYVMKLLKNGDLGWVRSIGDSSRDRSTAISVDLNDNVYVAGTFDGTNSDFDPGNCQALISAPNGGIFQLKLSPYDPNLLVKNSDTISSNANGATNFQWLDCDNNYTPVGIGDTLAHFNPTSNGNYAVTYTLDGCIDTSDCFFVGDVSFSQTEIGNLNVYPNPTSGIAHIPMDKFDFQRVSFRLYDGIGRLIYQGEAFNTDEQLEITISGRPGFYVLELIFDYKKSYRTKILKE